MKKQKLLFIFFSAALLFCGSVILSPSSLLRAGLSKEASAATINLPATGQTKCYRTDGVEIACAGTGQDGDKKTGVAWPNPRFTVNGDCITDNLTGQTWPKNVNLANGTKTWQEALDFVKSLNAGGGLCGKTDWRLPSMLELESLVNVGSNEGKTSRTPTTPVYTNGDYLVKLGFSMPGSVPNGVVAWSATPYNPRNQTSGQLRVWGGNLSTGETDYIDPSFVHYAMPVQGNACKYSLEKVYYIVYYTGGKGQITVHSSAQTCIWQATTAYNWIKIVGGWQGTGDGVVYFEVGRRDNSEERVGKIWVDDQFVTIEQTH